MYVCIYIYAGELLVCPAFDPSRVVSLATSRVISLSTFWPFGVWPPRKLLVCHFRTIKIGFFYEDFCDEFWSKLVFFGFFFSQISHLFFDYSFFLTSQNPSF